MRNTREGESERPIIVSSFVPYKNGLAGLNVQRGNSIADLERLSVENKYKYFLTQATFREALNSGTNRTACFTYTVPEEDFHSNRPVLLFSPAVQALGVGIEQEANSSEIDDSKGIIHFPTLKDTVLPRVEMHTNGRIGTFILNVQTEENQIPLGIREFDGTDAPFVFDKDRALTLVGEHTLLLQLGSLQPLCIVHFGNNFGKPAVTIGVDPVVYDEIDSFRVV